MSIYPPKTQNDVTAWEQHAAKHSVNWVDTLTQRLEERRISPEVIQTFDIQPKRLGWVYPVENGYRFKSYKGKPKNYWCDHEGSPKEKPLAAIYHAEDIPWAIRETGGACWLAAGEPDVWALRSAGVYHVLSGFTEAAIPDGLEKLLQALGVTVLYIVPDLDLTGERWAAKIAAVLADSGIELDCRELPQELGKGGDIGKAWQHYAKKLPFERYLLGLPRWYPTPETTTFEYVKAPAGKDLEVAPETRQAIFDKLGVKGFKNGWSINNVLCPFHDDHKPSANVAEAWGLYCHTCGQSWNWKATAEALGVDFVTRFNTSYTATTFALSHPGSGLVGLSIEAQQAFITLGFTALSRLLDVLLVEGYQGGEVITVKELVNKFTPKPLAAYTIRKAIEQGMGKQQPKQKHLLRVSSPSLFFTTYEVEKSLNKSKGRPQKYYKVPSRDEINQALCIEPKHYQSVNLEALSNPAEYRAEVCKETVRRKPGDYALIQLAKPLDISPKTAAAYMRRGDDIEITANFMRTLLTDNAFEALPIDGRELGKLRKEHKIKGAIWLEAIRANGAKARFAPCKESAHIARGFARETGKVYKVTQYANTYYPKGSTE